jgi:hypothetical protein
VLRRVSDPFLPDAKVLDELRSLGDTRLEAIHRIVGVVAGNVWKLLRGAAPPTNEKLNDRIKALVAERAEQTHRPRTRPPRA